MSAKKVVFISHIFEEKEYAQIISDVIETAYLGMLDTFVSSDGQSIPTGQRWLDLIDDALSKSAIQISLCSPVSIKRPWINFEAGASWIRKIPVIPICHSGLQKGKLPIPLALLQSVDADNQSDLVGMFSMLTQILGATITPQIDYQKLIDDYKTFALDYTYYGRIKDAVFQLVLLEPSLKQLFFSGTIQSAQVQLKDYVLMQVAPKLDILKSDGLLSYVFNNLSVTNQGTFQRGTITLTQKYLANILPKIK